MTTHESKKKGNSTKLTCYINAVSFSNSYCTSSYKKWGRIWWVQMAKLNLL